QASPQPSGNSINTKSPQAAPPPASSFEMWVSQTAWAVTWMPSPSAECST
ncbi:uncharacterized protein METZ01_LOCUS420241, partial [marine metagenome]